MVPEIGGGGREVSGAPAAGRAPRRRSRFRLRPQDRPARLRFGRQVHRPAPAASAEARGDERQRKNRQGAAGEERQWRRHGNSSRGEPAHYSDEAKKGEGAGVTKIGFFAGEQKVGTL